jgi:hypothetical protein
MIGYDKSAENQNHHHSNHKDQFLYYIHILVILVYNADQFTLFFCIELMHKKELGRHLTMPAQL